MTRRHRRKFTDEFKAETVKLIRESGRTVGSVARELDLTETAVRSWVKQAGTVTDLLSALVDQMTQAIASQVKQDLVREISSELKESLLAELRSSLTSPTGSTGPAQPAIREPSRSEPRVPADKKGGSMPIHPSTTSPTSRLASACSSATAAATSADKKD